jgi:hypothetical protein
LAKKVILEISKFAFNQHYNATSIYASRTHQTALTAQHTFIHLLIGSLILSSSHQSMHLAEVELGEVSRRTARRTRPATDARLKLGHFVYNLVALTQIIAVNVYGTGLAY